MQTNLSSFFGKELIYGSYLSRFLSILIFLLIFFEKNKRDKLLIYLIICLSTIAIFISGERAAFILTLISTFIIIFATNFFNKSKFFISIIIFFILSTIIFTNQNLKNKWESTIVNSFLDFSDNQIKLKIKNTL